MTPDRLFSGPRPDGVLAEIGVVETGFPEDLARAWAAEEIDPGRAALAWELARSASPDERRAVALLAIACLEAFDEGSTRVALAGGRLPRETTARLGGTEADDDRIREILAAAEEGEGHIVTSGELPSPLVVVDGELVSHRLLLLEERLARAVAELASATAPPRERASLPEALADVVRRGPTAGSGRVELTEEQLAAVRLAFGGRFALVTGGPGTGKTSIVTAILRVAARLDLLGPEAVGLAAPTGKAADRLARAVADGLGSVEAPSPADEALGRGPGAMTLHRLLGYTPERDRTRHHENNPLAPSLVIVDEGSMIDSALADRLFRSMRPGARLVLLGDAEQLPSVAAGSVFRDLVASLPHRVARLTTSFRMRTDDPAGRRVLELATAIRRSKEGVAAPLPVDERRAAADLRFRGAELLVAGATSPERSDFLDRWLGEGADLFGNEGMTEPVGVSGQGPDPADAERVSRLVAEVERTRLLTLLRGNQPGAGARDVNRRLRERVSGLDRLEESGYSAGEPVMVTVNDYRRGLFNGDQGILIPVIWPGEPRAGLGAAFAGPSGPRIFRLGSIVDRLERAWATTVHKAQGSEHDVVALLLPDETVRIATRELLYTAVTRARRSVVVVGGRELLEEVAGRGVRRFTGLAELLRSRISRQEIS